MQTTTKLLLIEDDRGIATALSQALKSNYEIEVASSGKMGIYKSDLEDYSAILLDLNLPDLHGLLVCQQLRERGVECPIIIVSGESKVLTKINLLDAGANDYLTKPFSLGELKARIRRATALSARTTKTTKTTLSVDDLTLNSSTHVVLRGKTQINLRRKEFAILECLMMHSGSVVSRRALARFAWNGNEDTWTNTIDVHIKHIRDQVDRPFDKSLIKTVHGIGYKIDALPSKRKKAWAL